MSASPESQDTKRKLAIRKLIQDPDTTATTLHVIALQLIGSPLYSSGIGGAEISAMLFDEYGGDIHETCLNKLQALVLASRSDLFFTNEEAFISICNSVCGDDPGMQYADDLTALEVMLGVAEVKLNHPDPIPPFSAAVWNRVQAVLESEVGEELPNIRQRNLITALTHIRHIQTELKQAGLPSDGLEDYAGKALLTPSA